MNYVSWGALYEGNSDRAYFNVLIPKLIAWLAYQEPRQSFDVAQAPVEITSSRSVEKFARDACQGSKNFHLCFVHADTGGRAIEGRLKSRTNAYCEAMNRLCQWPITRCVVIAPRKEVEAWVLGDARAVASALGFSGVASRLGLPQSAHEAEALVDPKAALKKAIAAASPSRRRLDISTLFPQVALRQDVNVLLGSRSFSAFIDRLREALVDLRIIG